MCRALGKGTSTCDCKLIGKHVHLYKTLQNFRNVFPIELQIH